MDVETISPIIKSKSIEIDDGVNLSAAALKAAFIEAGVEEEIQPAEAGTAGDEDEDQHGSAGSTTGSGAHAAQSAESDVEGEDDETTPLPAKKEYTNKGGDLIAQFLSDQAKTVPLQTFLTQLFLIKNGYGEPAFRFALTAADARGRTALTAPEAWAALQLVSSRAIEEDKHGVHLRRAWRTAEVWPPVPDPEEEPEPLDEEDEEAMAEQRRMQALMDGEPRVAIESFADAVLGDEWIASLFNTEVEVPTTDPETSSVPDEDED